MARLLIKNGLVVTVDGRRRIIKDGAVAIDGDRIAAVGKSQELAGFAAEKVIDAHGNVVVPGLVDAHCHHVQMLARGLANDVDLIAWCYDRLYPYETVMTDEDTYLSALLCDIEMIRTGTTCVSDPGGYRMDNVGRALAETGMRGVVAWAGMDQWSDDRPLPDGLPGKLDTAATLREEERLVRAWHGQEGGRIRASYALRVEPNVSDELYRRITAMADRDGVMIQMHTAVNRDQVEWVRRRTGRTTVAHMNELGVLGPNWLLIHMAALSDEEVGFLKEHDVKLCHNPGPSMKGSYGACIDGKFPEMMALGLTIGLGCDSSAANDSLDMFRAMYQVATVHKEIRRQADLVSPEKALEMATIDGARALHWDREIGSLEPGKKADLIIVDCHRPNWTPLHDFAIVPTLVYSGDGADVVTSIIDGRIVMEDREIKTVNVPRVLDQAQAAAERIVQTLPYRLQPAWPVA